MTSAGIGEGQHDLFKKIIVKAILSVLTGNRQKILVPQVRESSERPHQNGQDHSPGERTPEQLTAATIMSPRARSRETGPYQKELKDGGKVSLISTESNGSPQLLQCKMKVPSNIEES